MGRGCVSIVLFSAILAAKSPEWDRAHELYQRTDYNQSLAVLLPIHQKDAATLQLIGQNYFMLGDYKKSTDALEKASVMEPGNSALFHWLGRAFGRRAEMGSPFTAPGYATHSRQMFERSVALDPSNKEAVNDLFDFYLQAPGFLGGGVHKAEDLALHIARMDPAEGHYAQAQIEDKRKEFDKAETHLRRAAELAPRQVGRVLDIAMYLAKRGRIGESEAMFDQAARMAPDSPKILFERANTYIKEKRNLDEAKQLLERYIRCPLTPDDPPRDRAEALLKKIGA
jgi:tetratricopeptide (TPR) repeat protein